MTLLSIKIFASVDFSVFFAFLDNFSLSLIYLAISLVVIVGIWAQIFMLKRNQGKYLMHPTFALLSLLDSAWVFVSLLAFFWGNFTGITRVVPLFYVLYTILAFFYAAHTMNGGKEIPHRPEDFVFSTSYLNFAQSFCLVFFAFTSYVLAKQANWLPFF